MVRLDSKQESLVIDIKEQFGKQLADMVVGALWLYAATSEETRASLTVMSRIIQGEQPLVDIDLSDKMTQESKDA